MTDSHMHIPARDSTLGTRQGAALEQRLTEAECEPANILSLLHRTSLER